MKRIVFCIVWFVVFSVGGVMIGGAIVGGMAGSKLKVGNMSEAYAQGKQAGYTAGSEFGHQYGSRMILGAFIAAVIGSVAGVLPGTKNKPSAEDALK